ncbi:MAG: group II intron reverse transcriptase/maturase [Terriglobia bacterium]
MKSAQADSAASRGVIEWDQIDWPTVHGRVRRLQTRIAKATRDQDWRRVKALQRFLVNSFSAKALAVKRVSENDGKRTPGVDGEIWSTPGAKRQAIQRLDSRGFRPQPLRRVYIPKRGSTKMRPLGIPTMMIRAQQALHLLGLEPVAETRADPHSYGFRRCRGTQDAIERVFTLMAQKLSAPWILEGDIKGCFDNFGHGWLEGHIPMDKKVLRDWLQAGYVESGKLFPTEAGTPQGGIASPTIANIALDGLEATLVERFGQTRSAIHHNRVRLVRYADDFIITGNSKELLENEVKPCVEAFLGERGLEISKEKTLITHISEGFDFLGQNVRKYAGTLLIKPSTKNVKTFLDSVRETIRVNASGKQDTLINVLNPKIRGWANYHRHVVAKETYATVDHHIWQALWRWARRRHPGKSCQWVRRKYFQTQDHRHWVFATQTRGYDGKPRTLSLISASDTRIVRHVGVKSDANPFDPAWDSYFAERQGTQMLERLHGRGFPKRLWQQQYGICPGCGQLIVEDDRWMIQPLIPFKSGGARSLTNLKMLHSTCLRPFRIATGKASGGDHRVPAP